MPGGERRRTGKDVEMDVTNALTEGRDIDPLGSDRPCHRRHRGAQNGAERRDFVVR